MRKGLFIGINDYSWSPLNGCANDAINLATILSKNYDGSPNMECKVLVGDRNGDHSQAESHFPKGHFKNLKLDRATILKEVISLFEKESELVVLFFSGHGFENKLGGYFVTQDATKHNEGVALSDIVTLANGAEDVNEVIVILDCCHAGHLGTIPLIDDGRVVLRKGISILTSSQAKELSVERGGAGLFTSILIEGLKGAAADVSGRVTVAGMYYTADRLLGGFDQRPSFKSNVVSLSTVRLAQPQVPISWIRMIPDFFETKDAELQLDQIYEPTVEPRNSEREMEFKILQSLASANLVYPVGVEHMYNAAMFEKSCALTNTGRLYWQLVRNNKL